MAAKVRLAFLPVFLTLLSIAFAVALGFRIRSYRAMEAASAPQAAVATTASTAPTPAAQPSVDTIVSVTAPASGRAPESARVNTQTREQRYRELLAMGNTPEAAAVQSAAEAQQPTKPAAAPPQKPQSALTRLLKPIVNAVSGGSHAAQPPTVQHTSTMTPETSSKPANEEPADPDSDTAPPQLLAIEFNPPQIRDGEETMLVINATDNLSGIRGISGTLTSPTGKALQGFAQQRQGETDRYVSRITIPKDAEEGTWKISFLNLSDLATNMTTLSYAQGSVPPNAVLRVLSSRSDAAPPTLRAVSIARRAMHSGESNSLFIEAEDDKSGVRLISAVFVSPSKHARLGFGCKKTEGDTWECLINPPECLDCGEWQLEQVQLQDNANNYTTIRMDNPLIAAVRLNIAGNSCDNTPPVIQNLTLDKTALIIGQGEPTMTVRVVVTDDTCGIGGLSGQVSGPGTNAGTFFAFAPEGGDMWAGTFRLDSKAPRGIWRIQSVTVNDKGQNLRIYYSSDPLLGRGQFLVK
ncbi:MAG: hypothetical protein AABO58_25050 [Acidobacteriota bacterium]